MPGRDEVWKEETIRNTSQSQFNSEFECEFLGSIDTLVAPHKLKQMPYVDPEQSHADLDIFERPDPKKTYFLTADVSRGTSQDYSAFLVLDVSQMPYRVVAKYRNNEIKPLLFPQKIYEVAKAYNNCFVLVEVNDIGEQVANALQFDLEYDNLVMLSMRGRVTNTRSRIFWWKGTVRSENNKAVKKGCSNLKQMIESDKLLIPDYDIVSELSTFIVKFFVVFDEGCTDDLVACLFIFAWAVDQMYFKELTDSNIRERMYAEQKEQLEQDMAPFGFVDNGIDNPHEQEEVDEYGNRWDCKD